MRDIKFKIWLPKIGKMTRPCSLKDWMLMQHDEIPDDVVFLQLVINHEGTEFYEGDVIVDWNGMRVVEFKVFDTEQGYDLQLDDIDLKVIGNIYENPNLTLNRTLNGKFLTR